MPAIEDILVSLLKIYFDELVLRHGIKPVSLDALVELSYEELHKLLDHCASLLQLPKSD